MFDWFKPKRDLRISAPPRGASPAATPAGVQPQPRVAVPDAALTAAIDGARETCVRRTASATAVLRAWLRDDAGAHASAPHDVSGSLHGR